MISGAIVLYNTAKEKVNRAIESFAPGPERLLFIIDNSLARSEDYVGKPYITYVHNEKNIGYGAANNIGIKLAAKNKAKYHVVMNPDVYFEPSVIDVLEDYADQNKDVVQIMPKVLAPNGEEQFLAKLLPTPADVFFRRFFHWAKFAKKLDEKYTLKGIDHTKAFEAPFLSGCFMFLRVDKLWEEKLFFDETFFMYFEDCDLCRRIHRVGKTLYYPDVSIFHLHGRESYQNARMLIVHITSAIKYFCKYGWIIDPERKKTNQEVYVNKRQ